MMCLYNVYVIITVRQSVCAPQSAVRQCDPLQPAIAPCPSADRLFFGAPSPCCCCLCPSAMTCHDPRWPAAQGRVSVSRCNSRVQGQEAAASFCRTTPGTACHRKRIEKKKRALRDIYQRARAILGLPRLNALGQLMARWGDLLWLLSNT